MTLLRKLKPFDRKSGNLNVVIDTPKGSRNKYGFDFDIDAYKLKSVLPHGTVFPFDFGSIPNTVAADGDPLAVLRGCPMDLAERSPYLSDAWLKRGCLE